MTKNMYEQLVSDFMAKIIAKNPEKRNFIRLYWK